MQHVEAKARTRSVGCAIALIVLALAGLLASHASAAPPPLWETDGPVYAIAESGGTVYLGGAFDYVGPHTGSGVPLSSAGGPADPMFPPVEGGWVYTAVADGIGGWFIGGAFESVAGVPRSNLAHIRADGTLDPAWNPNADGGVDALAVSGSTVYTGGEFSSIGGEERHGIAALDAQTGKATAWNPNADGVVYIVVWALVVSGSTVYAGGEFSSIGGLNHNNIAALDATTGLAARPTTERPAPRSLGRPFLPAHRAG